MLEIILLIVLLAVDRLMNRHWRLVDCRSPAAAASPSALFSWAQGANRASASSTRRAIQPAS